MFKTKYTVSILDSKWNVVKNNIKILAIPRQDELIYMDDKYVRVLNIIHMLTEKARIFIVVEDLTKQPENILSAENQVVSENDKK